MQLVEFSTDIQNTTERGSLNMQVSNIFATSLGLLLLAAVLFLTALGTRSWAIGDQVLHIGIWEYCVLDDKGTNVWKCFPIFAEFIMATQAFSILAVLCYTTSFLFYLIYIIFPTFHQCRPLTMVLCLLSFTIVSLQMMGLVVFGVKVPEYFTQLANTHFSLMLDGFAISWSFGVDIISMLLATVSGICVLLEFRNITVPPDFFNG